MDDTANLIALISFVYIIIYNITIKKTIIDRVNKFYNDKYLRYKDNEESVLFSSLDDFIDNEDDRTECKKIQKLGNETSTTLEIYKDNKIKSISRILLFFEIVIGIFTITHVFNTVFAESDKKILLQMVFFFEYLNDFSYIIMSANLHKITNNPIILIIFPLSLIVIIFMHIYLLHNKCSDAYKAINNVSIKLLSIQIFRLLNNHDSCQKYKEISNKKEN